MSDLFDVVGSSLAAVVESPIVQLGVRLGLAYLVVVWLAAAYWTFRDAQRRTEQPVVPYLAAGSILVLSPVLFPAGILVYLMARPRETVAERADEDLRRSILEAEAARLRCPTCTAEVRDQWLICPACATRIRRRCPACDALVDLGWDLCAFCAADFRPPPEVTAIGAPAAPVIAVRRRRAGRTRAAEGRTATSPAT